MQKLVQTLILEMMLTPAKLLYDIENEDAFKEVQLNGDNKKPFLQLITVPKYFECSLKNVIQ